MKGKTLKPFMLSALMFLFALPVVSQDGNGSMYESSEDSLDCMETISAYREFFKYEIYKHAIGPWKKVFNDCPASSENIYVDGVTMYRKYIEAAPAGPVREGLIDTLMLIYDRRMVFFGGEGNVLGRKGTAMLTYRGGDIEEVQEAYALLKKSIEFEGMKSREAVLLNFISSGIMLVKKGKIDDRQVIEDYFMVTGTMDLMERRNSRWERTRATIDEIMLKEDILSCEALNNYFEPQFELNKNDKAFLEKVIKLYTAAGCDRSDIYTTASENLYRIEPNAESAHKLAILFISRNDFPEAAGYLKLAVVGENLENDTRAEWFYELAVVSIANKNCCEAIEFAREAIANRSDFGKAYIILGDAIIACRSLLGDDFQQRTAFWVAADMYTKAASLDPSLAEEAGQKLSDYAGQYPNHEDVFFRDLKDGDPYEVGGCINDSTTVRSRKQDG